VDDNYRVQKGELLAELDKEPYRIAVSQKKAAVDTAGADLQAAKAEARGIEAEAMSRRWKLQRAVEDLDNQIALLRARVAALDKDKAELTLAQIDFNRAKQLLGTPAESRQQYDRTQRTLSTADAQVNEALAEVYQARASLGLPAQPSNGEDLSQVPPDLDETFSSVLAARADLIKSAAQLGVIHSYAQSPKQMLDEFAQHGDVDRYSFSSRSRLRPSSRPRPSSKSPNAISLRPNWIFVIVTSSQRLTASSRAGTLIRAITFKLARI
jgi:membrane fusion protein, multidrug efflux system